jgi:hypothetical protein
MGDMAPIRLDDPEGRYGDGLDNDELELVTDRESTEDRRAVACKHHAGAMTRRMLERFVRIARTVDRARAITCSRLWVVAAIGFRADAETYADER